MDFSKKGVAKKQKSLVSKAPRNKRKISVSFFKLVLVFFLAIIVVCIGAGFGMIKGILDDTPEVNAEDLIPSGYKTTLYNQDGEVVKELSNYDSNREYVYYQEIPENLVNAFVSIEDERFWEHNGIDMQGILRAAVQTLQGDTQGASTITQQLIKNQIFNVGLDEKSNLDTIERKIQEQYLAVEIEKVLSKEEIIEYYLNTIYLGQGTYGVQTAAEYYFGKELDELTLSECAVLAAIPQNPTKYDPVAFPEENAKRRLSVLDKMLELGYITQSEYDTAIADNVYAEIEVVTSLENELDTDVNTYYEDAVIDQLEEDFMEMGYTKSEADNLIYSGGLSVYICQDEEIQDIVDSVINDPDNYPSGVYQLTYALTLSDDEGTEYNYSSEMMKAWYQETYGKSSFNMFFSTEEEAREAADEYKNYLIEETGYTYILEDFDVVIQPQTSFTIMNQENGQVLAISGGRGDKTENRSLNRATDSTRQPGSTFKVLAAFLPALDACGMGLGTVYVDEPYTYSNGVTVNNWYSGYRGACTIRTAIANSMNIIAVKTITDVTPELAYEYLLKLGFTTLVERRTNSSGGIETDINQSLALGGLTDGVTNLEITAAFAAIANEGNYIKPVFYTLVYDHDGNILIDNREPEETEAMTEQTAWLLTDAMHDVVTTGTGTAANLTSGMYTAGKTGTTSSNYDVWFCGFTPYYTASIWMGYDVNTEFSSGNYHKNMWRKIMDQIVEVKQLDTTASFPMPSGITKITVCKETGLLPTDGCETVTDYFAVGNGPTETCGGHKSIVICNDSHLPATGNCTNTTTYYYTIDDEGNLEILDADFSYSQDLLNQTCNLHPADETTEETTEDTSATTTETTVTGNTYKITSYVNGSGGSISPSANVASGNNATFYVTPDSGYSIDCVYIDGKSIGSVTQYTFTNVTSTHTISVTFKKKEATTTTTEATTTEAPTTTTEATTTTEDTSSTNTE